MRQAAATVQELSLTSHNEASPVVFFVDGDPTVHQSLEFLVRREGWEVRACSHGADYLSRPRIHAPSCIVLDTDLPDMSGLDMQRRISQTERDRPVIFVASSSNIATAVQAMKAGALEYFSKPFDRQDVIGAIRSAISISRSTLVQEEEIAELRRRHNSLSPREREVMALVVAGRMNKQIGGDLGISEITVKAHRGRVVQKMEAASLAHLVTMAGKLGIACAQGRKHG